MLSPALMFSYVNNKQEFGDGLPPWSDAYMNRKSSFISTDLFFKWFTERFLKHKPSGKVILLLDCHRTHYSSPLLFQTAVENNVTISRPPNHCTHTLQPLDKLIVGPLESYLKNEDAA
jgi:hypothetical protein